MRVVQVEVSTRCQLRCVMCPHTIFSGEWVNEDMDFETFKRIPFERFDLAHLQGWGEPLLNPRIEEMIDLAKKHCRVGLTTNGLLIDEVNVGKLDYLAVSIASAREDRHREIRKTSLEEILAKVEDVSSKVDVTLVFMMMKDTYRELPDVVELAKRVGAKSVIANNLDYVPSKELEDQAVFLRKVDHKPIELAKVKAKEFGVNLVVKSVEMEEVLVCAENPIDNVLITHNGLLTPCVYLHLPTRSEKIRRVFMGKEFEVDKIYFGRFDDEESWRRYRDFGIVFERRKSILWSLFPSNIPSLPDCCKTCYKAYGV